MHSLMNGLEINIGWPCIDCLPLPSCCDSFIGVNNRHYYRLTSPHVVANLSRVDISSGAGFHAGLISSI